jgi:hypothetical protein
MHGAESLDVASLFSALPAGGVGGAGAHLNRSGLIFRSPEVAFLAVAVLKKCRALNEPGINTT